MPVRVCNVHQLVQTRGVLSSYITLSLDPKLLETMKEEGESNVERDES